MAIVLAGVVTVMALCACGFLVWKLAAQRDAAQTSAQWHTEFEQDRDARATGGQAHEAAKAFAGLMINLDYVDFDRNVAATLENSTGEFKDTYAKSTDQLRRTIVDNKAKAHGIVVDSAIASESANKVTVLLFIDQSVSNTAVPDGRMDRSRVSITMEKVGDRWLASKVEIL
ncbi:hypothetical protein BI330_01710 [Mycobacterium sp. CBMA 623]|nr:hypothetical protein [Mycobacteroides sp. CBMA 326]